MQPLTISEQLLARIQYWENELDFELSPHPEPAERLDIMFEQFIDEAATLMSRLDDKNEQVNRLNSVVTTLQTVIAHQNESVAAVTRRNKSLEDRWTQLRKLLGIEQGREDWS